jgi:hypothetical protein
MTEKTRHGHDDCAKISPARGNAITLDFLHDSELSTTDQPAHGFSIMRRSGDRFDMYITETNKGVYISRLIS